MTDTRPPEDAEDRRREAPDGPEDDMRMDIHAIDVPKSTVAVALVLWGILAALGTWTLKEVVDQGTRQTRTEGRLDSLERRVDRLEERK